MERGEACQLVDQLFSSEYGTCVRYVFQLTASLELAEDITQQAFMMLYRNLRQGAKIDNPRAWLFCVIRREVIRHDEQQKRHGGRFQELAEVNDSPGVAPVLPGIQEDELERLFGVLTRRELEVILLRLQSMKYREIASQLGITVNTVKTLLARGLRKLQMSARGRSFSGWLSNHDQDKARRTLQ